MIASNFVSTDSGMTFLNEKITDLLTTGPNLPLQFEHLLIAISKNGGLIAICKKRINYLDTKNTQIKNNILVMHQDAGKRYYIPIDWDYSKSYLVSFDFNDKEQLYGFCNDGSLLKIDIAINKAVKKINSAIFMEEGIIKAKLFEKGFIALTTKGNIFYAPNIKNPKPNFIVNIKKQLGFSDNVDFLGIPPNNSKSGNFELLLINEKGNGLLHIEKQNSFDSNEKNISDKKVKISMIVSEKLEKYVSEPKKPPQNEWEDIDSNLYSKESKGVLGKINAMCMSPSKSEIAIYCAQNSSVYIFPSNLENLKKFTKLTYDINKIDAEFEDNEKNELKELLSYNPKYEFLYCGKNTVALLGQRFVLLINKKNEILSFKIFEENSLDLITGEIAYKCISEVDGIRYFSKDGIFLISEVSPELYNICDPFSNSNYPAKRLIQSYGTFLSKNAGCDQQIRKLAQDLPDAIQNLQTAAINLYFTNKNDESNLKEKQMFMLKASQYGKRFVQKSDFNFEKYLEKCIDLRIINSLRNLEDTPRFLTYEEYKDMDPNSGNEFIKKILRHHNYGFAFDLCNCLGYDQDIVYQRFFITNIKRIKSDSNVDYYFEKLLAIIKECPNISDVALAKKCIKHQKFNLAEKFLEREKSIVVKVPQYLQLKNWSKALDLSIQTNDRALIKIVIDKIFKVEKIKKFINIVGDKPKAHQAVIEYLRLHDEVKILKSYLEHKGDYEELLYITLENFFKCKDINDRKINLDMAEQYLKGLKENSDFYKAYLKELKLSLKFKKNCIESKKLISSNDISPFDNSIFECYKLGISKHYDWIESENKNFNIGVKKLTYIRFKTLAEENKFTEIDAEINKKGYKKLDISPLIVAKIMFNTKNYESAFKYIKEVKDPNEFEEKINLLSKMGRHKEALEIIVEDKKIDDPQKYVDLILREKPELVKYLNELQSKK